MNKTLNVVTPVASEVWPGSLEALSDQFRGDLNRQVLESATKHAAAEGRAIAGSPRFVGPSGGDADFDLPMDAFTNNLVLLVWECDTIPA